jgi:glycerol kinase
MSMSPRYLGAIGQGTISTRFVMFDRAGRCVPIAQGEHQQFYPQLGRVEHDPREILAQPWKRPPFQTKEVVDAMEQDSGIRLRVLRTDGGMPHQQSSRAMSSGHFRPWCDSEETRAHALVVARRLPE